jgi:inhibitor of cysteine peptidase
MERKPFPLLTTGLIVSLTIFACAASAHAALCGNCRDLMFVDSAGKCSDCGGPTASGALRLCPKCSARRHQCEHCLAALTEKEEAATAGRPADANGDAARDKSSGWKASGTENPDAGIPARPDSAGNPVRPDGSESAVLPPAAANPDATVPPQPLPESKLAAEMPLKPILPEKMKPINPTKPGTYTAGKWRFQLQIFSPGTRSEGRWGWLTCDGQKLPRGEVNDYYNTPWGPMYWVDVPTTAWGFHGWMPTPLPQNPRRGNALALPPALATPTPTSTAATPSASPRPQTLEINRSHNGQLARLHVGNVLVIRLPGNPATGYQWQVAPTNSPAMRLTVRPQYSPPAANSPAAAGTYTFIFQAVQPGSGSIRLYSVRPSDPGRPRDVFAVGVHVSPVATAIRTADPTANGSRN